jgi:hypothetical protein
LRKKSENSGKQRKKGYRAKGEFRVKGVERTT